MAVSFSALAPLFRAMRSALGAQAATTRVSVTGGLYIQKLGLRNTKDIDVVLKGDEPVSLTRLRDDIVKRDKAFTPNLERVCGVIYRDPVTKILTPIDIIDHGITGYMPRGTRLDQLKDTDIPWPEDHEFIKMKVLSASDRRDTNKGTRDLDDVKALLESKAISMAYKDKAEKTAVKNALKKALPGYLEKEAEWSADEWKAKLGLS